MPASTLKLFTEIELISAAKIQKAAINSNVMELEDYEKLKENISRNGFSDPIKVVADGDFYVVVDGHHRLKALGELGVTEIPCIKLPGSYLPERQIDSVAFNTLRGNQSPKELAKLLKVLKDHGYTETQLEKLLPYSEAELLDAYDLLKLPENAEEMIRQQEEEERSQMNVIWSFIVPADYSEHIESVLRKMGENKGVAFGEMCKRLNMSGRSEDASNG